MLYEVCHYDLSTTDSMAEVQILIIAAKYLCLLLGNFCNFVLKITVVHSHEFTTVFQVQFCHTVSDKHTSILVDVPMVVVLQSLTAIEKSIFVHLRRQGQREWIIVTVQ